jgi:hypothetical protein
MNSKLENIVSSFKLEFKDTHFVLKLKENDFLTAVGHNLG